VRAISDAEVLLDLAEEADDTASAREAEQQAAAVRRQLEQDLGIRQRADLRVVAADDGLQLLLAAQQRLGLLLVVPERRPRGDRIELLDLQALLVDVKATSGAPGP